MGTQGTGRKRNPNKDRSTAEDDALNLIAREAEARLAAKRAARAEAREIRMKELERQQKEIFQVQKKYYGLDTKVDSKADAKWGDIEQWMEDSERYSRPSRKHTSISDDDERMSVGSRSSVRSDLDTLGTYAAGGSPSYSQKKSKKKKKHKHKDRDSNGYDDGYSAVSSRSSRLSDDSRMSRDDSRVTRSSKLDLTSSRLSDDSRVSRSSRLDLQPAAYASSDLYSSNGLTSSRQQGTAYNGYQSEDRDYLEKGSRAGSTLSAATLASLGGTSSRRGSGEISTAADTVDSIREIKEIHELKDQIQDVESKYMQNLKEVKDALVEVEEKYRKAMVSNAQLDNEKNNLMYQVDTLKDSLMELEELLSESRREYEEKVKEHEREKHAHGVLQFQFNELKETLKQSEDMLTEIRQLRLKHDGLNREISDLQETVEWKDKKIGALERQKEYSDAIRNERDELRDEVVQLKDILKKHGIVLGPDLTTNGESVEAASEGSQGGDSASRLAQEPHAPSEGNSVLGKAREVKVAGRGGEEVDPPGSRQQEDMKEEVQTPTGPRGLGVECRTDTAGDKQQGFPTQDCKTSDDLNKDGRNDFAGAEVKRSVSSEEQVIWTDAEHSVEVEETGGRLAGVECGDTGEIKARDKENDTKKVKVDHLEHSVNGSTENSSEKLLPVEDKTKHNASNNPGNDVDGLCLRQVQSDAGSPEEVEKAEVEEPDVTSGQPQLQGGNASGRKKKKKKNKKKKKSGESPSDVTPGNNVKSGRKNLKENEDSGSRDKPSELVEPKHTSSVIPPKFDPKVEQEFTANKEEIVIQKALPSTTDILIEQSDPTSQVMKEANEPNQPDSIGTLGDKCELITTDTENKEVEFESSFKKDIHTERSECTSNLDKVENHPETSTDFRCQLDFQQSANLVSAGVKEDKVLRVSNPTETTFQTVEEEPGTDCQTAPKLIPELDQLTIEAPSDVDGLISPDPFSAKATLDLETILQEEPHESDRKSENATQYDSTNPVEAEKYHCSDNNTPIDGSCFAETLSESEVSRDVSGVVLDPQLLAETCVTAGEPATTNTRECVAMPSAEVEKDDTRSCLSSSEGQEDSRKDVREDDKLIEPSALESEEEEDVKGHSFDFDDLDLEISADDESESKHQTTAHTEKVVMAGEADSCNVEQSQTKSGSQDTDTRPQLSTREDPDSSLRQEQTRIENKGDPDNQTTGQRDAVVEVVGVPEERQNTEPEANSSEVGNQLEASPEEVSEQWSIPEEGAGMIMVQQDGVQGGGLQNDVEEGVEAIDGLQAERLDSQKIEEPVVQNYESSRKGSKSSSRKGKGKGKEDCKMS